MPLDNRGHRALPSQRSIASNPSAAEGHRAPGPWETEMHALIIEDEPIIAMSIEDVLRGSGYSSFDFICAIPLLALSRMAGNGRQWKV